MRIKGKNDPSQINNFYFAIVPVGEKNICAYNHK